MSTPTQSRRRFIKVALVAGAMPLLPLAGLRVAQAADLPKLPLDNATAKALNYVETTEGLTHPKFVAGSDCANCNFIQGDASAEWRPCTLFPGFNVASKGWCSAWAKKVG